MSPVPWQPPSGKGYGPMFASKLNCRVVLILSLALLVLIPATRSESSVVPKKSKVTAASYQDNPYQYLYGNVVNATLFRDGDQLFTNVQIKPVHTYPMFSQSVTFCDNQEAKLDLATTDPVVLVYSRTMHRRDCYELLRVDVVQQAHQVGLGAN